MPQVREKAECQRAKLLSRSYPESNIRGIKCQRREQKYCQLEGVLVPTLKLTSSLMHCEPVTYQPPTFCWNVIVYQPVLLISFFDGFFYLESCLLFVLSYLELCMYVKCHLVVVGVSVS